MHIIPFFTVFLTVHELRRVFRIVFLSREKNAKFAGAKRYCVSIKINVDKIVLSVILVKFNLVARKQLLIIIYAL